MKRVIVSFLMLLLIAGCAKKEKEVKVKFRDWNGVPVEEKASVIAENSIAGFANGVFQSQVGIKKLKEAYGEKGFMKVTEKESETVLQKANVRVTLITLDEKGTNILIKKEPPKTE